MGLEEQYDAWVQGLTGSKRASADAADAALRAAQEMQARLDALSARKERDRAKTEASLSAIQKAGDTAAQATAESVRRMSRELTQSMRRDGLLSGAAAPAPEPAPSANDDSFEGLAQQVETKVLGQDDFVHSIVKAFRRPFVLGSEDGAHARNLMLLCGAPGTGRHYTLQCVVDVMADRGLLPNNEIEAIDLSLYPGPAQEKLFLQDLYAALKSTAPVLSFDNYAGCAANYLHMLATLATEGTLPLDNRYVLQRGILVDMGSALAPGAIGELSAAGKYFVFFTPKDEADVAERFGARFIDALCGDICYTQNFTPQALCAVAARGLNELAQRARVQCKLTLKMGVDVRDLVVEQYGKTGGMQAMQSYIDTVFYALAEYVLDSNPAPEPGTVLTLTVGEGRLWACAETKEPFDLLALLPQQYRGDVAAVEKELDAIVGLDEVKTYVRDIAQNVQAQQRRKAQGRKAALLNMHMIFTGSSGTGKTTIARILAKYLKAIGALRGGQLVEVTRADLVGRYVGHTAPLTNSVIQSALGGVLFIDEAYSLYRGQEDSFGLEAIDTLVKGIEDHRNDLVVILAGYTAEMNTFLRANSGLASRFPNQIEFPDYTADELWQITLSLAKGKGYVLDPCCEEPLKTWYARKQAENAAQNGNGRMARNALERAILNQSKRLVADPDVPMDLLLPGDFELD